MKSYAIRQTYSLSGISDSAQLRLLALLISLSGSRGATLAIRCWAELCGVGFYGRTLVIGEREALGGTGMNLQTPGVAAQWAPFQREDWIIRSKRSAREKERELI